VVHLETETVVAKSHRNKYANILRLHPGDGDHPQCLLLSLPESLLLLDNSWRFHTVFRFVFILLMEIILNDFFFLYRSLFFFLDVDRWRSLNVFRFVFILLMEIIVNDLFLSSPESLLLS
jgi:hypothetical protein